jgi:outer membrane protein TolC
MKKCIIFLVCCTAITVRAQDSAIRLKDCLDAAMANKANIKAARTDLVVAGLQREEAKGRYLPDISVLYEYRYNPIIPTQVTPTGQFLPVPTGELRPIRFGTDWQQNAGLSVYQPIIDGTIKNRMEESRINERVKQADLRIAEEDLAYEVVKTFSRIMQLTEQRQEAATDTARTWRSFSFIRDRYEEGKLLKTELNNARRNHLNTLAAFRKSQADILKEQFYLAYLTGLPANDLLTKPYDFAPLLSLMDASASPGQGAPRAPGINNTMDVLSATDEGVWIDSVAGYQQLRERQMLLAAQSRTEQRRPLPSLGFQGFLGANQFTNNFNPFESNSWFGSSYLGLQVKVPILSSENRGVKVRQFAEQQVALDQQREDFRQEYRKNYQQASVDARRTADQAAMVAENVELMQENVRIYQDRVEAGKENTHELLLQEIDLQKELIELRNLRAAFIAQKVEQLRASGRLMLFIRGL